MNVSTRPPEPPPTGKLDWRQLLGWLRDDGMIEPDEADKTMKRFGSTQSAQHPLVRLAAAGLQRKGPAAGAAKDVVVRERVLRAGRDLFLFFWRERQSEEEVLF